MRKVFWKSRFKRDLKRANRNPRQDTEKLQVVIEMLASEGELPAEYLPHPLSGEWRPAWECHVQPDFLLVYDVDDEAVTLIRCGSHAELF